MTNSNFFCILDLADGEPGDAKKPLSVRKEGNARGYDGKGRHFLARRHGYEEGRRYYSAKDNYYNESYKGNRQRYYNDRSVNYNGRYNPYCSDKNSCYNGRVGGKEHHHKSILSMTKHYGQHHHVERGSGGGSYHYSSHQRAYHGVIYRDGRRQLRATHMARDSNAEGYKRDASKAVITGRADIVARDGYAHRSDFAPRDRYSDSGSNGLRRGYARRGNHRSNIFEFLKPADNYVYHQPSSGCRPRRGLYRDGGDSGAAPRRGNSGFMGQHYHRNGERYRKYAPGEVVTTQANDALSGEYANPCDNMSCDNNSDKSSNGSREGHARHGKDGPRSCHSGLDQDVSMTNLDSAAQFPALVPVEKKVELEG